MSSRFRKAALALPGAVEGTHQGHADFRVGKQAHLCDDRLPR